MIQSYKTKIWEYEENSFSLGNIFEADEFPILPDKKEEPKAKTPQWSQLKPVIEKALSEVENESPAQRSQGNMEVKKVRHADLFTPEAGNPKLTKSGKAVPGYYTLGLFLAPATMSGIDVCPCATDDCRAACLGKSAGRAVMDPVRKARIEKTNFLFNDPENFIKKLAYEIYAGERKAAKEDKKLAVRLNGISDIPWEYVAPKLFTMFPDVTFYDYTKIPGRSTKETKPRNYHLTLSSTGINHPKSNWKDIKKHLDNGGVVSMVFRMEDPEAKPKDFKLPEYVVDESDGKKYKVVDGDYHDHRHLEKILNELPEDEGVIAGLKLKGTHKGKAAAGPFAVPVPEDGVVKVTN